MKNDESTDQTTVEYARRPSSPSPFQAIIYPEPEFFSGKNKIPKWYKNFNPLSDVRVLRRNIVLHLPGLKRIARDVKSVLEFSSHCAYGYSHIITIFTYYILYNIIYYVYNIILF